jgi:pantothenate kinase
MQALHFRGTIELDDDGALYINSADGSDLNDLPDEIFLVNRDKPNVSVPATHRAIDDIRPDQEQTITEEHRIRESTAR